MTDSLHEPRQPMVADDFEAMLRSYRAPSGARPPVLEGDVSYTVEDYPVGRLLLAVRRPSGAVVASAYAADTAREDQVLDALARGTSPRVVRSTAGLDEVRRELEEFFAGRRRHFDVRTDLALAGAFQRQVLAALARIGYGRTTSYGALAASIGRPSAARAVGAALGANPLCVVLPCHRVVASGGALTGYAGGLRAKQYLLELERNAVGA